MRNEECKKCDSWGFFFLMTHIFIALQFVRYALQGTMVKKIRWACTSYIYICIHKCQYFPACLRAYLYSCIVCFIHGVHVCVYELTCAHGVFANVMYVHICMRLMNECTEEVLCVCIYVRINKRQWTYVCACIWPFFTLNACLGLHPINCTVLCKTGRVYRKDAGRILLPCSVLTSDCTSSTIIYSNLGRSAIIAAALQRGEENQRRIVSR
jgi:hypothetical protein